MSEKALFDPGFGEYVYPFFDNIQAIDAVMKGIKIPQQRKFKYKMLQPQIIAIVKNNVAFYLGCLMWAKYLKNHFETNKVEIENNPFFGVDFKEKNITIDDFCSEVNLLIDYFEKYQKDTQFYLGKVASFDESLLKITKIYKEFLLINNSFVDVKYTSDLNLPKDLNLVVKKSDEENKLLIEQAISDGDLTRLLDV